MFRIKKINFNQFPRLDCAREVMEGLLAGCPALESSVVIVPRVALESIGWTFLSPEFKVETKTIIAIVIAMTTTTTTPIIIANINTFDLLPSFDSNSSSFGSSVGLPFLARDGSSGVVLIVEPFKLVLSLGEVVVGLLAKSNGQFINDSNT